MNSTSHADNMIPLVGTQAKRKNTSPIEFDWGKRSKKFNVRLSRTSCCKKYYLR